MWKASPPSRGRSNERQPGGVTPVAGGGRADRAQGATTGRLPPDNLQGKVDIIARVHDTFNPEGSPFEKQLKLLRFFRDFAGKKWRSQLFGDAGFPPSEPRLGSPQAPFVSPRSYHLIESPPAPLSVEGGRTIEPPVNPHRI